MRFSILPCETNPHATVYDVPWEQIAAGMLQHARRETKEGFPLIAPAIYRDNYRTKVSTQFLTFLMLDLDHLTRAQAEAIWSALWSSGIAHVVYSTFRNGLDGPDDLRFRVMIPYSREVTPTEHLAIWDHFAKSWPIDPKCREVSRSYFLPECRIDGAPFAWSGPSQQPLDVTTYLRASVSHTSPVAGPAPNNRPAPVPVADAAFLRVCRKLARGKSNTANAFECLAKGLSFAAPGERDTIAFCMAQDLAREFPTARAEDLAKHFQSSLSVMQLDWTEGALTLEDITAKIQRALEQIEQLPAVELLRSSSGSPIACVENLRRVLHQDPEINQAFAWDEFSELVSVVRDLPWPWPHPSPRRLEDNDLTELAAWLMRKYRLNLKSTMLLEGVAAVAQHRRFHPVRDYLDGLTWDGVPRLATWLPEALGTEDSPYTRRVGQWWLMQAVARALATTTSVQADYTLILEGRQGAGKSKALRILAGDWFTSNLSDINGKDALQELSGHWIIELAELSNVRRAETNAVKNFLTRQDDTYRLPYGKLTRKFVRRCVFAGTTNDREYMVDSTGARRYWPVWCGDQIDPDRLREVRDQLWAEAYARVQAGEHYWPETSEDQALLEAEAGKRENPDSWAEQLEDWLEQPTGYHGQGLTTAFFLGRLGIERATRADDHRVVQCLYRVGFTRATSNRRHWTPPKALPERQGQVVQLR